MQFWQSLFLCEGEHIFDVTRMCDGLGFRGMMIPDHLMHAEKLDEKYPYSPDGKPPFFENALWGDFCSLSAALAAITQNLHFLSNVFILPLRNPIEVAKTTGSVAYFSNNRLLLGAGAGWMKLEFDLLGVDFKSRGRRFNECIEVVRKLQTGQYVEHHGEFFDFPRIVMQPAPTKPVPILIGGYSDVALRRAARLGDGWAGPPQTLADALATLKKLAELRAEYGTSNRPFNAIPVIAGPTGVDDLKRLEDAGATGTVSYPFTYTIGPQSTLEQKRAYLESFAENVIAKFPPLG